MLWRASAGGALHSASTMLQWLLRQYRPLGILHWAVGPWTLSPWSRISDQGSAVRCVRLWNDSPALESSNKAQTAEENPALARGSRDNSRASDSVSNTEATHTHIKGKSTRALQHAASSREPFRCRAETMHSIRNPQPHHSEL